MKSMAGGVRAAAARARGCGRARSAGRRASAPARARRGPRRARSRRRRPRRSSRAAARRAGPARWARGRAAAGDLGEAHQRVGRLADRVAADERAAAAGLDEAVGGELLDGAAHGRPAHAELLAQRPLGGQPVARVQHAALDALGDLPVDAVVERLGRLLERHSGGLSQCRCRHVKPLGLFWFVVVRSGPWRSARPGCGPTCASCPARCGATLDAADGRRRGGGAAPRPRRAAHRRDGQRRRVLRRPRALARLARGRRGRPADRRRPVRRRRARALRLAAGRRRAGGLLLGRVPRRGRDRARRRRAPVRGDHREARSPRWRAPPTRRCSSTWSTSARSRTRRRSRARTAPGSRCGRG